MAVTTGTDGNWKTAEGTLAEVRGQLASDGVNAEDVIELEHDDSSGNYVALYWVGHQI